MATEAFTNDVAVWAIGAGFGSVVSWLVWLTLRHYQYGKPAYEALAGTDLDDGHLSATDDRFSQIESSHSDLRERVNGVESKVDRVDEKTDRNYRLLERIADSADVESIHFRDMSHDDD